MRPVQLEKETCGHCLAPAGMERAPKDKKTATSPMH